MRRTIIAMAFAAASVACAARETAIHQGKLTSALNANGMAITNLPSPVAYGDAVNKAYVDSISVVTPGAVTNIASAVVTNDVAPWAMAGKSEPQGMTTNQVIGIVTATNETVETPWVVATEPSGGESRFGVTWTTDAFGTGWYVTDIVTMGQAWTGNDNPAETNLASVAVSGYSVSARRTYVAGDGKNRLGLARLVDLGGGGIDTNAVRDIVRAEIPSYESVSNSAFSAAYATNDFIRKTGGVIQSDDELSYLSKLEVKSIHGGGVSITGPNGGIEPSKITMTCNGGGGLSPVISLEDGEYDRSEITIGTMNVRSTIETKADSSTVSQLGNQVASIGSLLNGDDAHFVSTNYDSVVRLPEAYVEIKQNGNWLTIWKEMTRWNRFVGDGFDWSTNSWSGFQTWRTNVTSELSFKAERNWGMYDSETGGLSPEGYTQISSSNLLIAANMAYQRTVTSGGSVWVLQCNSGTATFGGETNGYFRVCDGDGNVQFEIVRGDRREMGADASGITVDNSTSPATVSIPYSVEADEHPTLRICDDLATANWKDETDSECIANVTWLGSSGAWLARVKRKTAGTSLFVKATYMAGGETYIRNAAPVSMTSIYLNGTKYYLGTATISGHTVLTLSTTAPAN